LSTRSSRSRARLPSSDFATASAMPPKSLLGSRTLVATVTLAGLSLCSTRPRFFSDSPLPYFTPASIARATVLVERIAAHHKSADRAAAEAQHRELHAGAPEQPQFHRVPPAAQAERSRCPKLRINRHRPSERNRERPRACPLGSRTAAYIAAKRPAKAQLFARSSRRRAPEVKVEPARLMPGGVADHEITRHGKIVC